MWTNPQFPADSVRFTKNITEPSSLTSLGLLKKSLMENFNFCAMPIFTKHPLSAKTFMHLEAQERNFRSSLNYWLLYVVLISVRYINNMVKNTVLQICEL